MVTRCPRAGPSLLSCVLHPLLVHTQLIVYLGRKDFTEHLLSRILNSLLRHLFELAIVFFKRDSKLLTIVVAPSVQHAFFIDGGCMPSAKRHRFEVLLYLLVGLLDVELFDVVLFHFIALLLIGFGLFLLALLILAAI